MCSCLCFNALTYHRLNTSSCIFVYHIMNTLQRMVALLLTGQKLLKRLNLLMQRKQGLFMKWTASYHPVYCGDMLINVSLPHLYIANLSVHLYRLTRSLVKVRIPGSS